VKSSFPNLNPLVLPNYTVPITVNTLNPWWLSGYFTLYCTFNLWIDAAGWGNDIYQKFRATFTFTTINAWSPFAQVIANYLGLSLYTRSDGRVDVMAQSREQALDVAQFFNKYPLQSHKHKEFMV
jgi:hypothetical protein